VVSPSSLNAALHVQGFFGRELPKDFGLQHAGEYLASNFGASYKYIWGLGLLAAGQASTMSGTYTGEQARITV